MYEWEHTGYSSEGGRRSQLEVDSRLPGLASRGCRSNRVGWEAQDIRVPAGMWLVHEGTSQRGKPRLGESRTLCLQVASPS